MRAFVIRARSAPTHSEGFLAAVGTQAHTEILAHALMNAIFVAQSHRDDVIVYLVLESTQDFSRTITFTSNELEHIGGFHEAALLNKIAKALDSSAGMSKEQVRIVEPGLSVRTISFEKLVHGGILGQGDIPAAYCLSHGRAMHRWYLVVNQAGPL